MQLAREIYAYGEANNWTWKDRWLGRFPHFKPMVKAGCWVQLFLLDHARLAVAFIANCFEKKEETSGKLLLWITSKTLWETWYIKLWHWRMRKIYGDAWLFEIMSIYFPPEHPFREASKNV